MKVKGLNNKIYSLSMSSTKRANASKLHIQARVLLEELFPLDTILEDKSLPGSDTKIHGTLFCDFIIPSRKLIFEVHGEQHYKYNSFHFESKADFLKAQMRDKDKKRWAENNDIILIELPYDRQNDWRSIINNREQTGTDREDT